MARKIVEFSFLGMLFRTLQLGAVDAFKEMAREDMKPPMEVLPLIEMWIGGEWVRLDKREVVNEHIKEDTGFIPAHVVLEMVINEWSRVNIGFINDWEPCKVPKHLKSDRTARAINGVDPIIASVLNSRQATLRELEDHYSAEDAIHLFDVNMGAKLDEAEAQYQAHQEAKQKAGR